MFSNQLQLVSVLNNSLRIARSQNYRVMLVLAGEANHHLKTVCEVFLNSVKDSGMKSHPLQSVTESAVKVMYVPDPHSNSDISDEINSLLGTEHACVVFDAQGEFNERLFAAAAGTITAGGLLVLQTPALHDWATLQHNASASGNQSFFISRLCEKLAIHCTIGIDVASVAEGPFKTLGDVTADSALFITSATPKTEITHSGTDDSSQCKAWKIEQNSMLESLLRDLQDKTESVSVVQGDRGRGKSTMIGRAMKKLLTTESIRKRSVSITANRRSACDTLRKHADKSIPYFPIDKALSMTHDILIVEEAGSIPIPVLEQLMQQSQSIVFATTVQGYEGAGRGFAIRFAKRLDQLKPGWLKLNPTLPVRWSAGDPIEGFVNDALLLKTRLTDIPNTIKLSPCDSRVSLIDKQALTRDDNLLAEVYGLLVQAHYQTTPADLRNLFDQHRLLVFIQRTGQTLTGAAVVALEGAIPIELHQAIMHKQRQLADQLLPQLLAQLSGEADALKERFARIVRIAIHPDIHRQGFGTHLFKQLHEQLTSNDTDRGTATSVGVSFGADQLTLSFWLKLGLIPIHYGYKTNPRSGLRAACLMNSSHLPIKQSIAKACQILRMNTQAQLSQEANSDPVQKQLLEATKSTERVNMSSLAIKRLIHDFCLARRSFIDSVGLLLSSDLFSENEAVLKVVHNTLDGYRHMTPKRRHAAEEQLRSVLFETGVFVEFK